MSVHSPDIPRSAARRVGALFSRRFVLLPLCAALAVAVAAAFAAPAAAEESESRRTLAVTGHGQAEVQPDRAVVNAALQVKAGSGREAKRRLESIMAKLLNQFAEMGIPEGDIKAESLRLNAEYENFLFSGYSARRDLAVTLNDLENIGGVTDLLAQNKEARIHGVFYRSSREEEIRQQALRRAMEDSRQQARLIARDYGMELGKPVRIVHAPRRHGPIAPRGLAFAAAESASAPYLADALSFEEFVEVVFEIH